MRFVETLGIQNWSPSNLRIAADLKMGRAGQPPPVLACLGKLRSVDLVLRKGGPRLCREGACKISPGARPGQWHPLENNAAAAASLSKKSSHLTGY